MNNDESFDAAAKDIVPTDEGMDPTDEPLVDVDGMDKSPDPEDAVLFLFSRCNPEPDWTGSRPKG